MESLGKGRWRRSFWEQPRTALLRRAERQHVKAVLHPCFPAGHMGRSDVQSCGAAYGMVGTSLLLAINDVQRW